MRLEELISLPKIEQHCHLDGSLSKAFVEKRLGRKVQESELQVPEDCTSLNEYLDKFVLPCSCIEDAEGLEGAGYDFISRMKEENVVYTEVRFAPLNPAHETLSLDRVLESLLMGLERGKQEFGIEYNVIVCAMRHHSEETNLKMFRAAREFLGAGVCAGDLAGAEALFPMSGFRNLFAEAGKLGMPFTIHAGECGNVHNCRCSVGGSGSHRPRHCHAGEPRTTGTLQGEADRNRDVPDQQSPDQGGRRTVRISAAGILKCRTCGDDQYR